MSEQKTVTVRIPVAVNEDGDWVTTYGNGTMSEQEFRDAIAEDAGDCGLGVYSIHWITAEVPIPQPVEVPGKVESGGER